MRILLFLFFLCLVGCKNQSSVSEVNADTTTFTTDIDTSTAIPAFTQFPEKKADSSKLKALKNRIYIKKGEFDEPTFIYSKNRPKYHSSNALYIYYNKDLLSGVRLVAQYYADDWLFIEKIKFSIDGKTFTYIPTDVKRDNDGGYIWEWMDEYMGSENKELIEALANAKSVKIRYDGRQYYDDRTVSASNLQSIKDVYQYFKASGGSLD
jgi:hypothetical protein